MPDPPISDWIMALEIVKITKIQLVNTIDPPFLMVVVLSNNGKFVYFYQQICLQAQGKGDSLSSFDGFFDLPQQTLIREDCAQLVGK